MNFCRLDQRAGRVGNAVDPAMLMISIGITGIVLHVSNQCILPIDDIERAIRCEFEVGGSKVQVLGNKKILSVFSSKSGVLIDDLMLLRSKLSDVVVNQNITLDFVREMPAGYEFDSGSWTHLVGSDDVRCFPICAVPGLDHPRKHP